MTTLSKHELRMFRDEAGLGICSDPRREFGRDYRIIALLDDLDALTARVARVEKERDEAQEHVAYHLRDFRPLGDMDATGDLAVDMTRYVDRLKERLAKVEALATCTRGPNGTECGDCRAPGGHGHGVGIQSIRAALASDPTHEGDAHGNAE